MIVRFNLVTIRENIDKLFLFFYFVVLLTLGLHRIYYTPEGLRHIGPILQSGVPAIGEPRWLLFPSLLFVIIKPLVWLGAVRSELAAARVFCGFNVICAFGYLWFLRLWLADVRPWHRAAVLLAAGSSYAFLMLAVDINEPIAAGTIAVAGLTYAKVKSTVPEHRRLVVAVSAIAVASLLYQGLLFGLFFLPAVFSLRFLMSRQAVLIGGLIVLAIPATVVSVLWLSGETPRRAVARFAQGEANVASSQYYSQRSARNLVGVSIVGPAYALAKIPGLRGLPGTWRMLRERDTALEAIGGSFAWVCSACAWILGIIIAFRKREISLIAGLIGVLLLPAIRMSQFGYIKYYVLLPLLMVVFITRLAAYRTAVLLGALLLASNISVIWAEMASAQAIQNKGSVAESMGRSVGERPLPVEESESGTVPRGMRAPASGTPSPNPWDLSLSRQNVCSTLKELERRIGLRRDATRAPLQGPEWQGAGFQSRPQNSNPRPRQAFAYCG